MANTMPPHSSTAGIGPISMRMPVSALVGCCSALAVYPVARMSSSASGSAAEIAILFASVTRL